MFKAGGEAERGRLQFLILCCPLEMIGGQTVGNKVSPNFLYRIKGAGSDLLLNQAVSRKALLCVFSSRHSLTIGS